jgi:hypothetical protein
MANDDHNREMIAKLKRKYRKVGEWQYESVRAFALLGTAEALQSQRRTLRLLE